MDRGRGATWLATLGVALVLAGLSTGPAVAATATGGIADTLLWLGVEPTAASAVAGAARADGTGDTFRFAVPGSEPATLEVPYGDIVAHVATAATIDGIGPDRLTDVPCNQALPSGELVLCTDPATVDLAGPWWLFVMEVAGPLPLEDDGLHHSFAVPVLRSGGTPWVPQGDFLWDTFQGTDLWLTAERVPGSSWLFRPTQASDFAAVDTGGFVVLRGATMLVAVPADALGYPHPVGDAAAAAGSGTTGGVVQLASATPPDTPRYGVHQHTHDGTFGRQPSDTSVVDAAPDTNTDERRTPDRLAVAGTDLLTVGAPPPPLPSPSPSAAAASPSVSPSPTATSSSGPGTTTGDEGGIDGGALFVTALFVGLAAAGTATVVRRRRPAPCSCRCRVTIEAPSIIETCCDGDLSLSTNPVEGEAADPSAPSDGSVPTNGAKLHVDLDLADTGWDFFDLIATAELEGVCDGGEVVAADATYDWSATMGDGIITLTVEVTAPVRCPDAGEHPDVTCSAEKVIRLREGRCRVGVVIQRVDWNEISHVDVVVECGSYREIFGYFPEGARTFSATIAGGNGDVLRGRNTSARPTRNDAGVTVDQITDQLGDDFSKYHASAPLRVYWIVPEDCGACADVRKFWEDLDASPGTYYLLNNNCALNAVGSLKAGGLWEHDQGPTVRPGQVETMLDLQQTLGTDGFTILDEVDIR